MKKQLVFVSVYPSFNQTFEQLCEELGYDFITIEARMEDAVNELKIRFPDDFPLVIISRGVTAEMIARAYPGAVVIRADPDDSDLIEALMIVKRYGREIGYLMHESAARYNMLELIKEILGLDQLCLFSYRGEKDMEDAFRNAKEMGLDAMVGGGQLGSAFGIKYKIPTEFLPSGQRTIWKAVTKAWDVLEYLYREHEQELRFRMLVNTIKDGIISVLDDKVTFINPAAEKFFNMYARQVVGKPVGGMNRNLKEFMENRELVNETIYVNGRPLHLERINKRGRDEQESMILVRDVKYLQKTEQKIRNDLYAKGLVAKYHFDDIISENSEMKELIEEAAIYAHTEANILICGENGTGKELFAQGIHNASTRENCPFVAINCAELPEHLLESELFGYVEGAFTGAKKGGRVGLIELAHRGTLFLDEINSTTTALQGKLLRVVQERELRRIGSDTIIPIDIRIIAAVNVDMGREIMEGRFRRDLFYRLNTLSLHIPPLRDRPEDIAVLAEHFCNQYCSMYQKLIPSLKDSVKDYLMDMPWYGNVRELDNVMHRYCVLFKNDADGDRLIVNCTREKSLFDIERGQLLSGRGMVDNRSLEEIEREAIKNCLEESGGNKHLAAKRLGISRSTLWRKLGEMNLDK